MERYHLLMVTFELQIELGKSLFLLLEVRVGLDQGRPICGLQATCSLDS